MTLSWLWFCMVAASLAYSCFQGSSSQMLAAAIGGSMESISIIVNLCAGYLLFCGLLEILAALGAVRKLERPLRPLMKRLMPAVRAPQAWSAILTNLSANLLGLGNAATPTGIDAMRRMEAESESRAGIRHDMNMLLILNATGVQLVPTTVLTLRVAAGAAQPNSVIIPGLICTLASTALGIALGLMCRRLKP